MTLDLKELRRLAEGATKGPWHEGGVFNPLADPRTNPARQRFITTDGECRAHL